MALIWRVLFDFSNWSLLSCDAKAYLLFVFTLINYLFQIGVKIRLVAALDSKKVAVIRECPGTALKRAMHVVRKYFFQKDLKFEDKKQKALSCLQSSGEIFCTMVLSEEYGK